jgi:NodT family efflux transporter outer membrane factor (OMF) lipoprotein
MKTRSQRFILVSSIAALALSGCTVGPDFHQPASPTIERYLPEPLPAGTAPAIKHGGPPQHFVIGGAVNSRWWHLFGSAKLDALEEEALRHNADIAAAQAALRQAHEVWLAGRASMFPSVELAASGAGQKNSDVLASPLSSNAQTYSLFAGQFNISYILDVFGGQRRRIETLAAQAEAQRFQVDAAYLALTTNVASTVLQIASLNSQLKATEANVTAYRRLLTITQDMQRLGESSTGDVASAESALEQAQQTVPIIRKQIGQLHDLLAVYIGRETANLPQSQLDLADFQLPAELPVSLPADLVHQRPDVRAAEAALHAASAEVGVATAARLPSFQLTGALGGISTALRTLLSNGNTTWTVGSSATQAVFDAGALRHQQKAAEAALDQARAQYRSTVLVAFQNTADVLQAIMQDAETLDHAVRAADAAARSSLLAQAALAHGEVGALTALDAEIAARQAQLALVQARTARYTDTVGLFQALGGGWGNSGETIAGDGK